jgi:hypothetical protein
VRVILADSAKRFLDFAYFACDVSAISSTEK